MAIRTDYILRLIEQCIDFVLMAAGLERAEEVEEELARAVSGWTGLDLELAMKLPTPSLVALLSAGEVGAAERLLIVGQAVAVRCIIVRKHGHAQEAVKLQEKAAALIGRAIELRPDYDNEKVQEVLSVLYATEAQPALQSV